MPVEAVSYTPQETFEERLAFEQRQWEGPGALDMRDVELKVCRILGVEKHPAAPRLVYFAVTDCRDHHARDIGTGLARDYTEKELTNRMVVVLANVEPVVFYGLPSEGLILCACKGDKVEPLKPPPNAQVGDVIKVKGYRIDIDTIGTITYGMFNTIAKDLRVDSEGVVKYKDIPMKLIGRKGVITSETLTDCEVKCPLRY